MEQIKVTREIDSLETLLTGTKAKVTLVRDIFVNGDPDFTEAGYEGIFYLLWHIGDELDFLYNHVDLHPEWKEKPRNRNGKNGKKVEGEGREAG